jgi:hypothetical protein
MANHAAPPSHRRTDPVRDGLRSTAKEMVTLAIRHSRGEKPDICLFATRRGGSTWLTQVIGANRGILSLNQPLEILTPNLTPYQYKRLPKFDLGQIVHPDPEQEAALSAYSDDLMRGRIRVNTPWPVWRSDFHLRTNRLLLKIVDAKPMMDWFDARYDIQVVYLVRHPIPQAMSCMHNGWVLTSLAYLRNEWFRDAVIADEVLARDAEQLHRDGEPLVRYVLNWVLENLYPLRVLPERPHWCAVSYEETVLDRAQVLQQMHHRLGLTDIARMQRASTQVSRSSHLSTATSRAALRSGDREAQVFGWRSSLTLSQARQIGDLLDRFGIALYSPDSPMPTWSAVPPKTAPG